MNRKRKTLSTKELSVTSKPKIISCSTPEPNDNSHIRKDSPCLDSDSLCDSEAASPVPFLCTQDGAYGDTDVVWNYYTPTSKAKNKGENVPILKNGTPLSRRHKRVKPKETLSECTQKKLPVRETQKQTQLFQDLLELNQNLHQFLNKKDVKNHSGSEDDIFNNSVESSPNSIQEITKSTSKCLRRNLLSSKFNKTESENLESDDSMNECLLKASQVVEEKVLSTDPILSQKYAQIPNHYDMKFNKTFEQDSMDSILNNIRLESPVLSKLSSSKITNDSFDNFIGDLNNSALERLSQMPVNLPRQIQGRQTELTNQNDKLRPLKPNNFVYKKSNGRSVSKTANTTDWTIKELIVHDGASQNSTFGRHNSMPESPTVNLLKPSTSGLSFSRYNSMPHKNELSNSPIKCTQDEIKKKHQQAKEKLLAKRTLSFTQEQISPSAPVKKVEFKPKVPKNIVENQNAFVRNPSDTDLKIVIERKRKEALLKLKRKRLNAS